MNELESTRRKAAEFQELALLSLGPYSYLKLLNNEPYKE
jgi:hypothetical protein